MSFAQYLVPLAVLEIYLLIQERGGARGRFAMAAGLFVLTVVMGAGSARSRWAPFVPNIKRAYYSRISIAETLTATIATRGVRGGSAIPRSEGSLIFCL